MRTVTKVTSPVADVGIMLGRQGESNALQVIFDLTWLIESYGDGTAEVVHKRSKDIAPYLCETARNGNTQVWTITDLDTVYDGWGEAELRWTVNETLAKTLVYKTMIVRSITGDTEIPEPLKSWYDIMMEHIGDNEGYAERAEQAAQEAEQAVSSIQLVAVGDGTVTLSVGGEN